MAWSRPSSRQRFRYAVDYVRRKTKGTAEVMLMTTAPCIANWDDVRLAGLVEAVRTVAAEKNCAFADISAAFKEAGQDRTHAKRSTPSTRFTSPRPATT